MIGRDVTLDVPPLGQLTARYLPHEETVMRRILRDGPAREALILHAIKAEFAAVIVPDPPDPQPPAPTETFAPAQPRLWK